MACALAPPGKYAGLLLANCSYQHYHTAAEQPSWQMKCVCIGSIVQTHQAAGLCSVPWRRPGSAHQQTTHWVHQQLSRPCHAVAAHTRSSAAYSKPAHTHTVTHTRSTALCPRLPRWAGTRKVKPIWIVPERKNQSGFYWSKRQRVAVASAGPYASLHLAPDR